MANPTKVSFSPPFTGGSVRATVTVYRNGLDLRPFFCTEKFGFDSWGKNYSNKNNIGLAE
jgi:hypothetical protein